MYPLEQKLPMILKFYLLKNLQFHKKSKKPQNILIFVFFDTIVQLKV